MKRRREIFFGWKVVTTAFVIAFFGWGVGFYGPGVYLVVLNRMHGWPISLIASAITFYYVLGAVATLFVGDVFERLGLRSAVLGAVSALALGLLMLTALSQPWQLYAAFAVLAIGWAGMSGAAINALVAPWFETRRGLAVSLALNGASFGGVVMVPLWAWLIRVYGFFPAALVVAIAMLSILAPLTLRYLGRRPEQTGPAHEAGVARADQTPTPLRRRLLLTSSRFWTIGLPFALALFAQVGFLTHQMSYLSPRLGAECAALIVSLTTAAAIVGRVVTGMFIDRIDRRLASAANFLLQAVAVLAMVAWPSIQVVYVACVLFGLGVGNVITLPSLIVQKEYAREHFTRVVSLVVAINQFTFAFGPGILGGIRDRTGSYDGALLTCAACEIVAALVVVSRVSR